ncbi:tetratricopeptide repeat protein [Mariluticola halotolerans]|uniref:tetratricopeptide repeat protein n=1 Tax=Mariluticola halotolerans TaxID=2909283 RepID=UPI0026E2BC23|nr:tetratricopeptide repeat protein [Mariluticola halotolerans]UJQ95182.1 tetratricopeptide repeat protein [Mariluticola halotolerans]
MSEETIFTEVDEELRRERMRSIWRRVAPYVIGAAVAIVLLVAGNEGWSWWQKSNAARSSDQFYTAVELAEAGDVAAAEEALNTVIAEGSGQYPLLARFRQAALLASDGQTEEAVAAYDALSTDLPDQRMRALALVLAANLLVDAGDVGAVQSRISGLLAPEDPMRNSAREALGLTQYAAGDIDAARATFEEIIADPTGSMETLSRIQLYLAQLIAEGAADPAPVAAPDTAASEATPAE